MGETVGTSLEANDRGSVRGPRHTRLSRYQSNYTFRYNPLREGALSTPKHSITLVTNLRVRGTVWVIRF